MEPDKLPELPLLKDIFDKLRRRHGFPLGVDEYLVLLRSLCAGFGVESREELEQLCCTLWAKSNDDIYLIRRLFDEMWNQLEPTDLNSTLSSQTSLQATTENSKSNLPESPTSEPPEKTKRGILQLLIDFTKSLSGQKSEVVSGEKLSPEPSKSETPPNSKTDINTNINKDIKTDIDTNNDSVQVVQSILLPSSYTLLTEYFPVTKRQMKQSWRYLRRPVREGTATELDVEATVEKMGREGILLEPVLVPRRINRTDLVLMIDQEGSMVPFHALSRQLVETAERGGRLKQTRVFYFHDYAEEYLYRHPALLNAQPIDEVLSEVGERAVVLIVSDAGAARGNFDSERVKRTQAWIEQLQKSVRYVAWLNPMPEDSWQHTTAGEIACCVQMFEMSRQGMNAAISVLRGRDVAWEKMY
jgi:hypothetical protein